MRAARGLAVALLLVAALAVSSCSSKDAPFARASSKGPRDVVVVAIDALRFDHTGLGGYGPPTTTAINRLGNESLVWTQARAASSYTLQSVSALMSGRLPTNGGSIGLLEAQPAEAAITLASAFRRGGYRTALATNQPLLSGRGFTRGFDDVAVAKAGEVWPCAVVVQRALAAFDVSAPPSGTEAGAGTESAAKEGAPRFLYLQFVEPHEPHTPAADTLSRFTSVSANEPAARYDAEIATADECVGAVVKGLTQRAALDQTVLVVLGTQGEELGEHGDNGSGWTLYDEVLRVPLVVHAPGLVEAGRTDAPASLVDLYPTLLALAGVAEAQESAALDGRALLAQRGGSWRPTDDADRAVIAELIIPERAIVRAVIEGKAKYVATIKTHEPAERDEVAAAYFDIVAAVAKGETPAQPIWGAPVREELYDLGADAGERTDVLAGAGAGGTPEQAASLDRLRSTLARYEQRCNEQGLAARQARPRAALPTEEEIKNLKSLSYL